MRRGLDFYANYNSGWRVLFVGGNWNNGGNAGVFNSNLNHPCSNANGNLGGRSAYFKKH